MNNATYDILKQAYFQNVIDYKKLIKHRLFSSNPIINEKIDYILGNVKFDNDTFGINLTTFTTNFIDNNSSSRNRLDETVVTFLLFISNQVTKEKIRQTFVHHGSWENEYSWMMTLKWLVYSIYTLVYNVHWKNEYFFYIDDMIIDLMKGNSNSLRLFSEKIGVQFSSSIYPAEIHYTKMGYHHSQIFGPYYWRMIHFVAEAFVIRKENSSEHVNLAKNIWREFTVETLYRTLVCGICMYHYKNLILPKYRDKLLNTSDEDYPLLWFNIHNDVNSTETENSDEGVVIDTSYSISEFGKDRKFMSEAILSTNIILKTK